MPRSIIVPVGSTLVTFILKTEIFLEVWGVDNVADLKFPFCRGECQGVIVGAGSASDGAAALGVCDACPGRGVVGVAVEGCCDVALD